MGAKYTDTHSVFRFEWWRDDHEDVPVKHKEALYDNASDRISELVKKGYIAGELNSTLYIGDYNEEEVSYSGWWKNRCTNCR